MRRKQFAAKDRGHARRGQLHEDLATVAFAPDPLDEFFLFHTVQKFHGAVVLDL